jgi:hypothetical protein
MMQKIHYGGAYIKDIECPVAIKEYWAWDREHEIRKKDNPTYQLEKVVRFENPKPKVSSDIHKVNCLGCFSTLNNLIEERFKLIQSGGKL